MKIGFTGLDIQEGKNKYQDKVLAALANKDKPKKISPFFVEFLRDDYIASEAIVVHKDCLLDILILDLDKIERRINRSSEQDEKKLLEKCLVHLEKEQPLCDMELSNAESKTLNTLSLHPLRYDLTRCLQLEITP